MHIGVGQNAILYTAEEIIIIVNAVRKKMQQMRQVNCYML